jgi:hypothetical protein
MGAIFFAVLAVAEQIERNYIRERPSKASSSPPPGATTADDRRSSTTTDSPSPSH